jgi:integrase
VGEIRRRDRNGKITYLARHYGPQGRKISKQFKLKRDAELWLAAEEVAKADGRWVSPAQAKVTVGVWADEWLKGQARLKQSAQARYRGIVERHIRPRWGVVPLNRVTHADVVAWLAGIDLSASSVRHIHRTLSLIMELAVRDGRLARNPAAGVKLPKLPSAAKRFLTRDEVFRLADAAAEHGEQYRVLILLLAFCGLRWGEAAGLRVKRLDLMRRRLTVAETLIDDKTSGALVWETPKNHQARAVHLPPFLADQLAEVVAGKQPDDLVFTSTRGKPMSNGNFRRYVFDHAAEAAGLSGITPHVLRHTAASLAVSAGANVKAVQRMLGHASAAMTLDVYAGLFDSDLEGLAERLDAAYRHQAGTKPTEADVISFPK